MSNMTSIINVNVPTNVKNESNEIFVKLGLNMTTAINIFLKKVIKEKGIPFELKLEAEKDMRDKTGRMPTPTELTRGLLNQPGLSIEK